jgi:hypothetical protein
MLSTNDAVAEASVCPGLDLMWQAKGRIVEVDVTVADATSLDFIRDC